jgi:type IV pilus assembly protein PilM
MGNTGLGVTIGSHSLRAVKLRRKGAGYVVQGVFSDRLDDSTRSVAGRALAARGLKGLPATVGLTGRDVIIRYTQVPPVPDWRLETLMKFEVDEVGQQSGGDVSADYRKLDLPDPEGIRDDDTILVALARNTHVDSLISSLGSGGIKYGSGCPNSVALFNAFAINATYTEDETALLVNIGSENVDIAIQQGGELIFARNATPGGKAFTEAIMQAFSTTEGKAEKMKQSKGDVTPKGEARYADATGEKVANAMMGVAGQLSSLIQSTLMIAKAQTRSPDLKIDQVQLAGGGASLKGLCKYLQQAMGIPVKRLDPFEICDTSGLTPDELQMIEAAPHEFAVAVGLAQNTLSPAAFCLDLLPTALKRTRDFATKGVFAVAAAVVALGALYMLYSGRKAAADDARTKIGQVKSVMKKADKADNQLRRNLVARQDAEIKHELLAQRAAPGALLVQVVDLLEVALEAPELRQVYIQQIELKATDRNHSITQWVPKGKVASGYIAFTRSRKANMARQSEVEVTGRIGGGQQGAALYSEFYAACRANKLGLHVEAPSQFVNGRGDKDGSFKLLFRQGRFVPTVDGEGREDKLLVQDIALDNMEDPTAFVGRRIDGMTIRIPLEEVADKERRRLVKELQAKQ